MTRSSHPALGNRRLPFKSLTAAGWQNLALSVLVLFYVLLFIMERPWRDTCGRLAGDFCAFWSAGYIANHNEYADVYDLGQLERVQRSIFSETTDPAEFITLPFPYFPVLILPFQLFALLKPMQGYWIWVVLNLAGLAMYLRFFTRKTTGRPLSLRLLAIALLSWPVFLNLITGQMNVLLAVFAGESLRAAFSGKPFKAGLWLAGLLIKPQFQVLIVLALLIQRAVGTLAGLLTTTIVILGSSALLLRAEGILQFLQLWSIFARGQQKAIAEGVMVNWRMVQFRLGALTTPTIGWVVAIVGITLTLFATLYIWRKLAVTDTKILTIAVLGTLAATSLVSWHSHTTSAIILLPPLIFLTQQENCLPKRTMSAWSFTPTLLYVTAFILVLIIDPLLIRILPARAVSLLDFLSSGIFLSALGVFGFNVYFLIWAVTKIRFLRR